MYRGVCARLCQIDKGVVRPDKELWWSGYRPVPISSIKC